MEFEADGSFCEVIFVGDKNAGKPWGKTVLTRIGIFIDGKPILDFSYG